MGRIEWACLALGAVLLVAGVAWVFPPAGLMVAGLLLLAGGMPRGGA